MEKPVYTGAIFDQDGLLFDTEKIYQAAWLKAAGEQGVDMDPEFPRRFCGKSPRLIAAIAKSAYPELDVRKYCDRAINLSWSIQLESIPEKKPGLDEMLSFCRDNGIKTAVASSSTNRVIEHNLESAGIRGFFDAVVSGDEVEKGKPAPDIFLLAAQKIGIPAERCCVFEDAPSGLEGALAAGAQAVMVPDTVPPSDEIRSKCLVFANLADARKAFRQVHARAALRQRLPQGTLAGHIVNRHG